ncbi:extracellular solute-binding protein [Pedobacter insulae]|uniref:Carbohydrate ABC transporter substrate-binding protein, CUT1 family n=1 Tax=Pedobacter insulae TaxID=414048 RepID=A0A1I2YGP0_9SPHI|nr:extracellular solute-binding protein [Pedobacter insulae]SFH24768.1 carbohydrate ABC transporter substrate-binding protein, CUT1 family [Pedobacter insulae]
MNNRTETFKIAVRKFGPFETAMQKFWDDYCLLSGCTLKLELVIMDLHELHDRTLTQHGLANGEFDVAHINTDWIYEGYANNAFEVLNSYINQSPPIDFPDGWSASLLELQNFGDEIVGLPFHDGPECLIYRKDLFENEREQTRYFELYKQHLGVPKTWQEFQQVSQFFNRPDEGLFGAILACYPDGHNTVFDFCLQLWSRGGNLIDPQGKINVNTPASLESLDFYRKLVNDQSAVHQAIREFDSVAAGMAFSQGQAAMMINWFGFAAMAEVDEHSKVKGKVNVDLIMSASLNVYWLYTIGKGSMHKNIAYDFIRFATNTANDRALTLGGGIGCRKSTWNDVSINQIIPYYHKLEALHTAAKMLPQHQNWAKIAAVIDQMVLAAINTNQPAEEILTHAQQQIAEIEK